MTYSLVSLAVALASLFVSFIATRIAYSSEKVAKSSLAQAERSEAHAQLIAKRDHDEWKQRQWFELYFKASEFSDAFDHFQAQHGRLPENYRATAIGDFTQLMLLVRRVHSMAAVFPKNPAIDGLFAATAVFSDMDEAFSLERLAAIRDAVEGLRQKALVDPSVLE